MKQFEAWFKMAVEVEKSLEPNMFCLSTSDPDGFPNNRFVLMKEVSEGGFVFFSNYESTKGKEIDNNNRVALCFYWPTLNWQVRIRGWIVFIQVLLPKSQRKRVMTTSDKGL